MTTEIAAFRIPEPKASEVEEDLDQLQIDTQAWIDGVKTEAQERWGRDPILLAWRDHREVYGIEDVPWGDRPNRHAMPTKEWKRLDVPDGWERLVDHGNKPDALRPRLKATKDWVKGWTEKAPPTSARLVADALGIQTSCLYNIRMTSFGYAPLGEHGGFLIWPEDMIEYFEGLADEKERLILNHYVPEYAERVPLSEYYAAKEAHEAEAEQ